MSTYSGGISPMIKNFWSRVTAPTPANQSVEQKVRANISTVLILVLMLRSIANALIIHSTIAPDGSAHLQQISWLSAGLFAGCFGICRIQRHNLAITLSLTIIPAISLLTSIYQPSIETSGIGYLFVGILLASFTLPVNVAIFISIAYIVVAAIVLSHSLNLSSEPAVALVSMVIISGLLILYSRLHRRDNNKAQAAEEMPNLEKVQRERLRVISKNLPSISAVLVNHELRIMIVEGAYIETLSPSHTAIEGKTVDEAFAPELARSLSEGFLSALNNQAFHCQIKFDSHTLLTHFAPFYSTANDTSLALMVMHDMTDMLRADEARQESEIRYQLIAENSTDIISVFDPNGSVTYVSPSVKQVIGYDPEDLVGHTISTLLHDQNLDVVTEHINNVIEGVPSTAFIHKTHHKNGAYVWLETNFKNVRDEHDNSIQIIAASRDISHRMAAQLALERSEEQLRALIASMDNVIFSIDLEGKLLVFHDPSRTSSDAPVSYDELIERHYRDVFPPELTSRIDQIIPSVMFNFETRQLEYHIAVEGKPKYFSARLTPMISSTFQLLGVTCVSRDITESTNADRRQRRLLELEQLHRAIITLFLENDDVKAVAAEALKQVGEFLDISHASLCHIRDDNQLLDDIYIWHAAGLSERQTTFRDFAINEFMPSFLPLLRDEGIIEAETITQLPEDIAALLGLQGVQSYLALPIFVNDRLEGFTSFDEIGQPRQWLPEEIAAARALTQYIARGLENEQSQIELIEARDAALHSAKLKSEFMSNMSHEIRTPMTGLIGMLELLQESPLTDDQSEFAEVAHTSAQRLMRILDDILDFSKMEAGKVTLEDSPVDLRSIVNEVVDTYISQASKKQIHLHAKVDDAVPARLLGDPARLRQALANLVSNAVKFTQTGSIEISVKQVASAQGRARLRFEVEDSGIGISEAQIKDIFTSFVQADNSITRSYGGAGLGLPIAQQIIALMGGEIDVKSVARKGSIFGFTLTMTIVSLNEHNPSENLLSHVQVIIASPENVTRYVLSQQLRRWSVSVIEIDSLDKTRDFLENAAASHENVNAVFMQNTDDETLDWIQALREDFSSQTPKFILISDQPEDETARFDRVLTRPIRLSDLYNTLLNTSALDDIVMPPEGDGFITMAQAGHILLADDDEMNWKIVIRALAQMGYVIDVAHNGREALTLVEQQDYALILMDINMPIIDGLEATKRIRAMTPPKSSVPIIASTASTLKEDQQTYLDAGINALLAKPFSIEQLRETVRFWISQSLRP